MTAWSIEPSGLQTLLTNAETEKDLLYGALEDSDFETIYTNLQSAGDIRGDVFTALSGLFEDNKEALKTICSSVTAGIVGTTYASRAYMQGNEDMATSVEAEMMNAADTGDFTYFEQLAQQEEGVS
ncbi:hypothetical protein EII34_05380 [Arachnia propionica]|uniref:Uncharacterized protein n=1 Tax=Arachnia propionica TaxID=1750 RepID=A0A3P1TB63_9ACTN|nr:DUF6507 family protein [Arachnia propionica]MDO5084569.1 DUF6507 family protein [Arachnia propionica]RRD06116.1 hypothetical protein EII34_05380 [Arachnia propionica]